MLIFACIFLSLFNTFVVAEVCEDIDSTACEKMAQLRTDLCSDPSLSQSACPKFCNLCPITCFNCNATVQDYHFCATKVNCPSGYMCMLKKMKSVVDGHFEYEMTCATKQDCDDPWNSMTVFGKRHVESRDISVTCCAEDLCNYPEQITTMSTKPTTTETTTAIPTNTTMSTLPKSTIKPITSTATRPTTTNTPSTKPTTTKATTSKATHKPTPRITEKTTTPLRKTTELPPDCVRDVVFVVDETTKLANHHTYVQNFLRDIISSLPISSPGVHVALGMFARESRTVFDLNSYHSEAEILQAIENMTFLGGSGDINVGLNYILHHALTQQAGDRPKVPNVVVILTDDQNHASSSLERSIQHLATVITIEVDHADFKHLASDSHHLFHAQSLHALTHIDHSISQLIC